MSKKEIVNQIKKRLTELGVTKGGCQNLNITLPSNNKLAWVSYTQIQISVKVKEPLYRNKRYGLYSKDVDLTLLELILNNLKEKVKN